VGLSLLEIVRPDRRRFTEQLVRTAIMAGVDCISVHGRTRHQTSAGHPVNLEQIAFAQEVAKGEVPIVANGDVFSFEDAKRTREVCGVKGVMSARGLLENPVSRSGSMIFWSHVFADIICWVQDDAAAGSPGQHLRLAQTPC
jgi:tRNA-dihydrouridine synthase